MKAGWNLYGESGEGQWVVMDRQREGDRLNFEELENWTGEIRRRTLLK